MSLDSVISYYIILFNFIVKLEKERSCVDPLAASLPRGSPALAPEESISRDSTPEIGFRNRAEMAPKENAAVDGENTTTRSALSSRRLS